MRDRTRQRNRYNRPGTSRSTVALFVGALLLLLASGGLIVAMVRAGVAQTAATPTPGRTAIAAAASATPTIQPTNSPLPPSPTTRAATAAPTTRPGTAVAATPASPTVAARATPRPPTVSAGNCALALPPGFAEEKPGGGYYPAADRTGFVALDTLTSGSGRTPADLTQAFIEGTLRVALQDFRQTSATGIDGGSRVDYTAKANGQNGRGVVIVRQVGGGTCGVTLFLLDTSPLAFDATLDYLLSSLQPARP